MKFTLFDQVSCYIMVNIKSCDKQNYLVIRGFSYIHALYKEVPLYSGKSISRDLILYKKLISGPNEINCFVLY